MEETVLANEPTIRLSFFLGTFAVMALWEVFAPRRVRVVSRWVRWTNNLGIVAFNTAVVRIFVPTAAVGLAVLAAENNWGLLNQFDLADFGLPVGTAFVIAVLVMDLAIYLQHVMFHAVPLLWRFHRMHHTDLDFDVTTGARFHPVEIILSVFIKLAVVLALGPSAVAVLVFEVVLNATAMFNHSNVKIPVGFDRILRLLVVTPDMHRVHHSVVPDEANSNFGFNVPWWDRLLGTYRAQPSEDHEKMIIGVDQFRRPRDLWLDLMLIQPFRGKVGSYPINRRGSDKGSEK